MTWNAISIYFALLWFMLEWPLKYIFPPRTFEKKILCYIWSSKFASMAYQFVSYTIDLTAIRTRQVMCRWFVGFKVCCKITGYKNIIRILLVIFLPIVLFEITFITTAMFTYKFIFNKLQIAAEVHAYFTIQSCFRI